MTMYFLSGQVTYQFSYPICHNDANKMTPNPFKVHNFQIFNKIDSFLNKYFKCPRQKKVDYFFEERLNLHLILG